MDKNHNVVSAEEWLKARLELLAREKEFTRLRDHLSQQRRELPWERVDKQYEFDGPNGKETLAEVFENRSQLIVYHFMFAPDWEAGCRHCSWWADNFERNIVHLNHRDVTMVAISHAPLQKLETFRKRMGWTFKWLSAANTDFNYDYHVSFTAAEVEKGEIYQNYRQKKSSMSEVAGASVFYKDPHGTIFHTYSCYERGLDMLNAGYHLLDLVPKGRDEDGLAFPQAWVRYRDSYEN
ncbi:MAG: DUF899 domain-containing protein [Deltaproteobacteria bacterium]|nr:DUF899 domain-containing protein [Deltaproteobacteria bacterium]